jgi:hypothetical protein
LVFDVCVAALLAQLLLLSRGCVGFGLAGAPVAFTLMMELLPAASRSTWGTLVELAWTAGRERKADKAGPNLLHIRADDCLAWQKPTA